MTKKNAQLEFDREHPSYGCVRISRVSGNIGRLYGSSLRDHHASIRLEIAPSKWTHHLNQDWFHGSLRPHIEVEMSAAQFAEAITTLNHASGVPCTVRHLEGKRVEDPPDLETEVEQIKSNFKAETEDMVATMTERRAEIEKLTAKLPEKSKQAIRIALDVILGQVTSNLPFIINQFDRATTRVVTAAKAEIEAFAMHRLIAAGEKALATRPVPHNGPCAHPRIEDEP